jgi:phage protein D
LNVLHRLRPRQYTTTWTDKRDSEIAENIATLKDKNKQRFPLPIVTDPNAKAKEPQLPYVAQKNEYDLDFLLARARQRGYVVYVSEGNPDGQGAEREPHLYFGPSNATHPARRDVSFELKWGISLIDFKPTLTTANQIKSVTVNSWNRATRQPIRETVTLDDRRLNLNRDLHDMLDVGNPREEFVVDEPVYTPAQARERALAVLMDRHKEIVKASGTCVGLPDLHAGQRVQIAGVGARFSGTYFVTETTHTINDSGYTTRFNARREHQGK